MTDTLLEAKGVKVYFKVNGGIVKPVDGVDFKVERGKVLGIVGESGSGKSMTALSIMQLLPKPNGYVAGGEIMLDGVNLLSKSEKEMRKIRGNKIAMIFQEPMTSLNPVFRIGNQMGEALKIHQNIKGKESRQKIIDILNLVRIPSAEEIINQYPHQLSGGMRQRVMIAMAMCCNPQLLIADEPTTALDVTIQAQILELMRDIQKQNNTSIIFITHDLGVIAEIADNVAVMYAGKIVEEASVTDVLRNPLHPYTKGLISAIPENYDKEKGFYSIPGMVPNANNMPVGCSFAPRCSYAKDKCFSEMPELKNFNDNHKSRCWLD